MLLYIIPLIICIYGIINALKTKIEKITLKYQGYKNILYFFNSSGFNTVI